MPKKSSEQRNAGEEDCDTPPAIPKEDLHKLMFRQSEQEFAEIASYVEWQSRKDGEKVIHAEKVAQERVMGRQHDVWDVHTDKSRWWVITGPTNLYSQQLMPSLDYTLSFHIGLMARMAARHQPPVPEADRNLLLVTSRKLKQLEDALEEADEAEEFQAVGMRCRETLLSFIQELSDVVEIDIEINRPKNADFIAWSDLISNSLAPGGGAEYTRGYLKATAERTWRLANWLTHTPNAARADAELTFGATVHVIMNLGAAALKKSAGAPVRCGKCGSYRIRVDWRPELGRTGRYVPRCEACGAEGAKTKPRVRRTAKKAPPTLTDGAQLNVGTPSEARDE